MKKNIIKQIIVVALCGILLVAGSCVYDLTSKAQEDENVVIEDDLFDEQDDFEEIDSVVGWGDNEWLDFLNGIRGIKEKQSNGIKSIKFWIDKDIDYYYVFDYDVDGYLTKCTVLTYGEIVQIFSFEYDSNGNKIKLKNSEDDGSLLGYNLYEYDSNGNLTKETYYDYINANGKVTGYRLYEYDNNGNMTKDSYYGGDYPGSKIELSGYNEYEYNNGKITKTTEYTRTYANGVVIGYEEIAYATWEYDGSGKKVKYTEYVNGGDVFSYIEYEYDNYGRKKKEILYNVREDVKQVYDYDVKGNLIKETYILSDGTEYYDDLEYEYYDFAQPAIQTSGIYCASTSPSIVAGLVIDNKNSISSNIEYQWLVFNETTGAWSVASDWTVNNEYMNYTPAVSGNYIFLCKARIVGDPDSEVSASFGTPFTKTGGIKQICQMPYEGGGYLIGFESYDNPNQEYQYEMFVMDLSLLAAGSPTPWVHATGKIKLAAGATPEDGKTMWTIWQPQYGYYLTLFRLYDKDGNMIDEVPYGFANAY
ncbi:MAG: hypothetical protein IJ167_10740 [Lachnospiraceae bacterium]|nr:hypothetical protein [Lachnospiraceae bacterium]